MFNLNDTRKLYLSSGGKAKKGSRDHVTSINSAIVDWRIISILNTLSGKT